MILKLWGGRQPNEYPVAVLDILIHVFAGHQSSVYSGILISGSNSTSVCEIPDRMCLVPAQWIGQPFHPRVLSLLMVNHYRLGTLYSHGPSA
ncbi:hypothetical protein TNCV_1152991 [Trichonephila clavipes]|nr:hypothetical protein TNCV_1152991 [Trichonephila clavipes]